MGKEREGLGVQKMEIEIIDLLRFLQRPNTMLFPVQASLGSPITFYIVCPCYQISHSCPLPWNETEIQTIWRNEEGLDNSGKSGV